MIIARPDTSPQTFEGITNCYIGSLDLAGLFPNAIRQQPRVTLIYESVQSADSNSFIPLEIHIIRRAIDEAYDQYLRNIEPETGEERFIAYLTDELGLSEDETLRVLRHDGISAFLSLEQIFVSQPYSALCFDFQCFGEKYLNEYGFSFDLIGSKVEFV